MNLLGSLCEHIADIIMGQQCFQYITYIILTTLVYELNCAEMNMFLNGKKYIVKMDLNISERFYTCLRGERTESCTVLLKDSIKNTDLPAYDVKQNNGTITYSDPAFQCELQKSCTLYVVCFGPFDTYTLICKVNNKKCSDVHACGDRYFKIFWTNTLDSLADKELTLCQSNSSCSSYAQKWTSITTELYGNTEITNTAAHRHESTLTSLYNSTNTDSRDGAQATSTSNNENVTSGSTSMNEASHNNFSNTNLIIISVIVTVGALVSVSFIAFCIFRKFIRKQANTRKRKITSIETLTKDSNKFHSMNYTDIDQELSGYPVDGKKQLGKNDETYDLYKTVSTTKDSVTNSLTGDSQNNMYYLDSDKYNSNTYRNQSGQENVASTSFLKTPTSIQTSTETTTETSEEMKDYSRLGDHERVAHLDYDSFSPNIATRRDAGNSVDIRLNSTEDNLVKVSHIEQSSANDCIAKIM